MWRHKIGKILDGTILCLLKYGSVVTQIQRQINRMTIWNVSNGHGKERNCEILSKKNHVVYRRYPRTTPNVAKNI